MTNLRRNRLMRALVIGLLAAATVPSATGLAHPAYATGSHTPDLAGELRTDIQAYLRSHHQTEHVSAAALSLSLPGRRSTIDVSAGTIRSGGTQPVTPSSVWQVGSDTKAFTSVLLLRLEAEHRLSIEDTLGRWLPQYPQWRDVPIRRLLNMTGGIASYEDQPALLADFLADPYRYFSTQRLVGYVTGAPRTSGYSYSNTNYVLAEMIIEKATGDS
jgi:D-alanyl-D-alanine carboxypeptidase